MKRWIGALILIAVSAALVAGLACYPGVSDDTAVQTPAEDDTTAQTPEEDDPTVPKKVSTEVSDTTGTLKTEVIEATSASITYTMANISEGYVYDYGSPFSVQQKIDGEWYSIPELPLPEGVERGWTMEG